MTIGPPRGSLRGMEPLAPILAPASLAASLKTVLAVATDLEALARDFPGMPREMADRVKACAASLRAIGGPTDPNAPAGS